MGLVYNSNIGLSQETPNTLKASTPNALGQSSIVSTFQGNQFRLGVFLFQTHWHTIKELELKVKATSVGAMEAKPWHRSYGLQMDLVY